MPYIFNPIHDKVVIKPVDPIQKKGGALDYVGAIEESSEIGEIIAIGPGTAFQFSSWYPTTLKVGQLVLIPKIGSFPVTLEGQIYYITREAEILSPIQYNNE